MNKNWTEKHSRILYELFELFNKNDIKYFVLRNYKELPEKNLSKDVDIIIDPKQINSARKLLKECFKNHLIEYFYETQYFNVFCSYGINLKTKFSIHIDLISSYTSKGYEIFTFEEMYEHKVQYKNFYALNEYFEGVMLFIYKQFNYHNPKLKDEYKSIIKSTHFNFKEFRSLLFKLIGEDLSSKIIKSIENDDFDEFLKYSPKLTKELRKYSLNKFPIKTRLKIVSFLLSKLKDYTLDTYKKAKVISAMAPDGAGKTTFLDNLLEEIRFCFVNDNVEDRCSLSHFRPNILPNLGELGEKAKIKEQDKDFTNPHRAKPAGTISSLVRITYYWLDYIIGYQILVRKDIKTYKFTVFDRYSYDFIVDPGRTRLGLPKWIRKTYVKFMAHPKIVFYLKADPDVIYKRKQELTLEEIKRQNEIYLEVAKSHPRFKILDANRHYDESVNEALHIILDTFCERLN